MEVSSETSMLFLGEESPLSHAQKAVCYIISFISVDPYRIRNPYGYGKWSHNHRVYRTIKTIFVSLAPYKLFDILR